MEKTLKEILNQNHSRKTKQELIELLEQLNQALGEEEYSGITGIQLSELEGLTKKQLIATIDQFKDNYKEEWEAFKEVFTEIFNRMEADEMMFSAASAASADFAAELGDIDFANLIGGPLNACVTAQSNASIATVNFVKEVGFEKVDPNNPNSDTKIRMVDFKHKKKKLNPEYDSENPGSTPQYIDETVELEVPFITLLNVPCLRIETCEIDFNVKLNSTYTKNVSSELGVNASVSGGFWSVKFKVSASYKRSSSTGVKVEKQYTMGVKVKATNDEMPAGLEKVLGILAA